MSEIKPPSRPMMAHELYPVDRASNIRESYVRDGEGASGIVETEVAYRPREAYVPKVESTPSVEAGKQIYAYDVQNGKININAHSSGADSGMRWIV